MLGEPLQGLLQAWLDAGDLVIPWSFSPSSSVSHRFSFKQLPSKWWQSGQAPLPEQHLTTNEGQGGKMETGK